MGVHIYRSTDASAPVLNGTSAGSLITVLKACLVNGFGSGATATPAGWTLTTEDAGTYQALFRNDSTTGSGRYFWVKDDGIQTNIQVTPSYDRATITGANTYTGVMPTIALQIPFPRTISGTDRHSDTHYGTIVGKGTSATSDWIVIADEYTCYLITAPGTNFATYKSKVAVFGDAVRFGNVSNVPRALVAAAMFTTDSDLRYAKCPGFINDTTSVAVRLEGHLEHSITNTSGSVSFYSIVPSYWKVGSTPLVPCEAVGTNGYYVPFIDGGSPTTKGLVAAQVAIAENPADVLRTYTHTDIEMEAFAYYPGFYRCGHIIGTDTYKVGNNFDIVQVGGKDYLLVILQDIQTNFYNPSRAFMFDITGPWR